MKVLLPVLLAIVAGFLNFLALSRGTVAPEEETFLQASEDVPAGAAIADSAMSPVVIAGTPDQLKSLRSAAVPLADKAVVIGNPAPRALKKGDLILWRDTVPPPRDVEAGPGEKILPVSLEGVTVEPGLLKVGREIGFLITPDDATERPGTTAEPEFVGPFKLLSVGTIVSRDPYAPAASGSSREGDRRVVSVAARLGDDQRLDAKAGRLVAALSSGGRRRIASILLYPAADSKGEDDRVAGR